MKIFNAFNRKKVSIYRKILETNFDIEIEEKEDGVFKLTFNKNEEKTEKDDKGESLSSSYVVVFSSFSILK